MAAFTTITDPIHETVTTCKNAAGPWVPGACTRVPPVVAVVLLVTITVAVITITITIMLTTIMASKAGPRKATYKAMIMVTDPIQITTRELVAGPTIIMISSLMTPLTTTLIYIRAVKMLTSAAMVIVIAKTMTTPKTFTTKSNFM